MGSVILHWRRWVVVISGVATALLLVTAVPAAYAKASDNRAKIHASADDDSVSDDSEDDSNSRSHNRDRDSDSSEEEEDSTTTSTTIVEEDDESGSTTTTTTVVEETTTTTTILPTTTTTQAPTTTTTSTTAPPRIVYVCPEGTILVEGPRCIYPTTTTAKPVTTTTKAPKPVTTTTKAPVRVVQVVPSPAAKSSSALPAAPVKAAPVQTLSPGASFADSVNASGRSLSEVIAKAAAPTGTTSAKPNSNDGAPTTTTTVAPSTTTTSTTVAPGGSQAAGGNGSGTSSSSGGGGSKSLISSIQDNAAAIGIGYAVLMAIVLAVWYMRRDRSSHVDALDMHDDEEPAAWPPGTFPRREERANSNVRESFKTPLTTSKPGAQARTKPPIGPITLPPPSNKPPA